jgi:hypothetical protein
VQVQVLPLAFKGETMPFKSVKQRKWMYANKPALAKKWTKKYGSGIVKKKKKK